MTETAPVLREVYDRVRHQYGDAIGRRREELVPPALVLDIDVAQRTSTGRQASSCWLAWPRSVRTTTPTRAPISPAASFRRARAACPWPR